MPKTRTVELLLVNGKTVEMPAGQALTATTVLLDNVAVAVHPLTDAQKVAIKQGWKLPDGKIGDLREQLAAVKVAETPTAADLVAADPTMPLEDAEAEAKRLARNAKVNEWRARKTLQAAIDTRGAKYELLRAAKKKGTKAGEAETSAEVSEPVAEPVAE